MYELSHTQQVPPEVLQAQRSVILRLGALEQRGITPTYEHYGLEQHFCLDWRRCRTYLSRTRLPSEDAGKQEDEAKVNSRPAWGMSRTRAHMYHGIRHMQLAEAQAHRSISREAQFRTAIALDVARAMRYACSFKNLPRSHPTGAVRRVTTAKSLGLLGSSHIIETIAP